MADIDIVHKERSNLWIWIVLAVVVLLALYFLFGRGPQEVRSGAVIERAPAVAWAGTTGIPALS
jgi:hypothetical protein